MFAEVIVDVATENTNRIYDYIVPDALLPWVTVGSRVGVTFGPRVVQGYVIQMKQTSEYPREKCKPITRVLDSLPPLTKELIDLSVWVSERYACHRITAIKAMLPSALRAKYKRVLRINEQTALPSIVLAEEQDIIAYIQHKQKVELNELLTHFPKHSKVIQTLIQNNVLLEQQEIKDKAASKQRLTVIPPHKKALQQYVEQCSSNAKAQLKVLHYFIEHNDEIAISALSRELGITTQVMKAMEAKGWLQIQKREVARDPYAHRTFETSTPLQLTTNQQRVYDDVSKPLSLQQYAWFLLHGVTGSGKTEIYLQLIQQCLDQGREAIVLVPEIALTAQMVERFKSRFGDLVAVLHSRLSTGERYDEWKKIKNSNCKVVIGARSALFAPFDRIGLIIIDEEHESTYKQEESPKYHAKHIALKRAQHHQAVVVLGSATPSLETYYAARRGKENYLGLHVRVGNQPLPPVQLVDMREELKEGNRSMFSRALHEAIEDRCEKGEQIVLLMNRRGFSTFVLCRSCGFTATCPHCEISLTYHRHQHHIRCHYCGYTEQELKQCPDCQSEHIRYFGVGTQRVEEQLTKYFPGIRVIRMDMDTTREKGSHEKWLTQFREKKADVLLGTQMVAKGLDFPDVTLVGVIAADTTLKLPDFRAAEKTFQLLTQVSGRAGRHELPGEVIIQTYNPDHYSLLSAQHHDYEKFVLQELNQRKLHMYPPYCHLLLITFSHEHIDLLIHAGEMLVEHLSSMWQREGNAHQALPQILGPVSSPLAKVKDRYRFQCVIKYLGEAKILKQVQATIDQVKNNINDKHLMISIDVDPQMML